MEQAFGNVVKQVFNNWTALKLAVDHSMGGPNSKQNAIECMNYTIQHCLQSNNIEVEDIQEALEDILDEEFSMICEDNSPKDVATILFKFLTIVKSGNAVEYENEFKNLPNVNQDWLSETNTIVQASQASTDVSSSDDEVKEPPSEWTEVKSRRKKM